MKKFLLISLILLLAISFYGCTYGSEITIGSFENNTLSSMSMKYQKFSGNKSTNITVKENEVCKVSVDIETEDGEFDLIIKDENDNIAYQGNDIPTSSFLVIMQNPGKYKIRVDAKDHKGSYTIKWEIE